MFKLRDIFHLAGANTRSVISPDSRYCTPTYKRDVKIDVIGEFSNKKTGWIRGIQLIYAEAVKIDDDAYKVRVSRQSRHRESLSISNSCDTVYTDMVIGDSKQSVFTRAQALQALKQINAEIQKEGIVSKFQPRKALHYYKFMAKENIRPQKAKKPSL